MKTQIRLATIEDLSHILNLYRVFDPEDADNLTLAEAETKFAEMTATHNQLYVVLHNEEIVGSFALLIIGTLVHKGRPAALIDAVVVDQRYRQQGIGKDMLKFAMTACQQRGCYKLALSSNLKWQAKDFYEKVGFKQHGLSFHVDL